MPTASLFLSHASRDKTFVNQLIVRLKKGGVDRVSYDYNEIDAATVDVHERIRAEIRSSDYFAILLSSAMETSQWVSFEIQAALAD